MCRTMLANAEVTFAFFHFYSKNLIFFDIAIAVQIEECLYCCSCCCNSYLSNLMLNIVNIVIYCASYK